MAHRPGTKANAPRHMPADSRPPARAGGMFGALTQLHKVAHGLLDRQVKGGHAHQAADHQTGGGDLGNGLVELFQSQTRFLLLLSDVHLDQSVDAAPFTGTSFRQAGRDVEDELFVHDSAAMSGFSTGRPASQAFISAVT